MIEMAVAFGILGFLALVAIPVVLALAIVGLVLKGLLLLLILPFKLLFFGLAGLVQMAGALIKFVAGFILFVVAGVLALALLLIPAVPIGAILLMAALTWLVYRIFRRPQREAVRV